MGVRRWAACAGMRGLRSCPSVHGPPRPPTNIAVRSGRSTPPTRMRSCRTPGDRLSSALRSLRVALSRPTITWRRMGTLAGPSVPARTTTPDARTALHAEQRAYPAGSAVEMRRQIQHARRRDELVPHPSQGRVACSMSVRAQLRQEADRSSARRPGVHSLARRRKPLSRCLRGREPRDLTTRTTRFT